MENSWNSQQILCNLRKNSLCALTAACVKQSTVYAAKCIWCTKTVDLSNMGRQALVSHMSSSWCGMTLDIWRLLLRVLFVVITSGKVTWLWRSLENSEIFFLLLCGHPVIVCTVLKCGHFLVLPSANLLSKAIAVLMHWNHPTVVGGWQHGRPSKPILGHSANPTASTGGDSRTGVYGEGASYSVLRCDAV